MENYVITFSDVMAGVITFAIGALGFFIKGWFNSLRREIENTKEQIKESDKKVNQRIDKLEERTNVDIDNIKKDLSGIKGEFATTFVPREDYFRSMNSVEDAIRRMDSKMDRLLLNSNEKRG